MIFSINPAGSLARVLTPVLMLVLMLTSLGVSKCAMARQSTSSQHENFDPANFDDPSNIDNPWKPLTPGTRFVFEGTTVDDEGEVLPHRVEFHVTDLTKVIDGLESVVMWDLDFSDGELVEAELAFFAQDNDGNVWRMGEHPEEYEEGEIVDNPTWISGIDGSVAGISMLGNPTVGSPSYSQGWAPSVEFTDRGQVYEMGVETTVPAGSYDDVLIIVETSVGEPDARHFKYFARGVGEIRVGWAGEGEKTQEVLELTKVEKMSPEALAEVREKALALEKNAYEINEVYAATPPAKRRSDESSQ